MNCAKIYAMKRENEKKILKLCPDCPRESGIYFLLREEDGFKYAYIGQSVNLLQRLADHLQGYQHIDLSIRKHGLWSDDNPTGYKVHFLRFPKNELDEKEQYFIKKYANAGWQMRNSTAGSQGEGKHSLDNQRPVRTYYEGVKNGYERARKEVAHLFNLHLDYKTKSDKPNKNQQKAYQKFKDFLEGTKSEKK